MTTVRFLTVFAGLVGQPVSALSHHVAHVVGDAPFEKVIWINAAGDVTLVQNMT